MILALGISSLPAFCFYNTQTSLDAELLSRQIAGKMEFIPAFMESAMHVSGAQPNVVILHRQSLILLGKPASLHIILCKKTFSAGQVCAHLPLRL